LYQKLLNETWIQPWLDEEELHPGQTWETEIEKAVESSDVVLVCLSNNSIHKKGYVQKELRFALDIALEMPEETIFIVPLRLEECVPPRSLREWQYADYFEGQRERAFQKLLISLEKRADSVGLKYEKAAPKKEKFPQIVSQKIVMPVSNKITFSNRMEFMRVPAGKFLMGTAIENQHANTQHAVDIPYDYWMSRFPVINSQYSIYVDYVMDSFEKSKKDLKFIHPVADWEKKKSHPVVGVSLEVAIFYCKWLNNLLVKEIPFGFELRLPNEAEWEKAARGTEAREYPWGNNFNKDFCNTKESAVGDTTPVGMYSPDGDSPYGCADMAGNVWEGVYHFDNIRYKYQIGRYKNDDSFVKRGGSFANPSWNAYCHYSAIIGSYESQYKLGFRLMLAMPLPE
jgi:formylglycine-generating enzyme required for sulfatase activity